MLLLFIAQSFALGLNTQVISCPVGTDQVKLFTKNSGNSLGGWDPDLAIYDSDGQYRNYAIATCQNNLLSLYAEDMQKPFKPDQITTLEALLPELQKQYPNPDKLNIWDRYDIAVLCYQALQADPKLIAELYMNAAWTIRDQVVGLHQLNGPEDMWLLLISAQEELKKDLSEQQRKLVLYNLARVAHRFGAYPLRDSYLNMFLNLKTLTTQEQSSTESFSKAVLLEEQYLKKAQAILLSIPDPTERELLWIAEIHRRQGNTDTAKQLYQTLQSQQSEDRYIKKSSEFFIKWEPNALAPVSKDIP